jgi:tetratricopeptide (TPR) repeat protein
MSSSFSDALKQYKLCCSALERTKVPSAEQIIDAFVARDAIQAQIGEAERSAADLLDLEDKDLILKRQMRDFSASLPAKHRIAITRQLNSVRDILRPDETAWWWFLQLPVHWWDRLDPVWGGLAFIWLAITFSLVTDISSRFLGGNPGTFGAFAIILQSLLALAGGGAFTKTGQVIVNNTLRRWNVPQHNWQIVKVIGATLLLVAFIGFRLSLPWIAIQYNNAGVNDYINGKLDRAESKYLQSLELDPGYATASYNLGVLYERLGKIKDAQTQYGYAVAAGLDAAYSNLGRLYILTDKNAEAATLLLDGLTQSRDDQVRYSMLRNLGWARLNQGRSQKSKKRLQQAKERFEEALDIPGLPQEPKTHCLLAQTLDELGDRTAALSEWQQCKSIPSSPEQNTPELDNWLGMAENRLSESRSEP